MRTILSVFLASILVLSSVQSTVGMVLLPKEEVTTVTISAAGDAILGGDNRYNGYTRFMSEYQKHGLEYFLLKVRDIFEASDLSILNLEGPLTDITSPRADKQFAFRGPMEFAKILSYGNIDVVSLANNHTHDYFDRGYTDTQKALEAEDIAYFGNEFNTILEVNGIQVGLFGYRIWGDTAENRSKINSAIKDLQDRGAQLIIAYHHWGVERATAPSAYQISIGRYTIDQGAHLVLGNHPHIVQGIETYKGRSIVYSLGDFCFGGNGSRADDTMIFQQTFTFIDGVLKVDHETNIIPVHMSSVRTHNNMQPIPAEGSEAVRILDRIKRLSDALNK